VDLIVIPCMCLAILLGTRTGLALIGPFEVDYSMLRKLKLPYPIPAEPEVMAIDVSRQWLALVNLAALMFALSGLTMAISAAGRSRWKAVGIAALLVVAMFVANVVGQLWDDAAWVRPATVFYYYQPQRVWLKENWTVDLGDAWAAGKPLVEVPVLLVLGGLGAGGYLLALRVFTRRDLPAPL
jgi:ABC-2 type transport system permease protein